MLKFCSLKSKQEFRILIVRAIDMGLIVSAYPKNILTDWHRFDSQVKGPPPRAFGFLDDTGEVNRFAARYRLARSFSSVTFDSYSSVTISGYEGLLRLFFVWSAFEQFLKITKRKQSSIESDLHRYDTRKLLQLLRTADPGNRFLLFVHDRTNQSHKKHLKSYFTGQECNVTYLASAIRHVFVHGSLTPSADQTPPGNVKRICDLLSKFLLSVMDKEFTRHMDEFDEMMRTL
jgi:hypothetical protein